MYSVRGLLVARGGDLRLQQKAIALKKAQAQEQIAAQLARKGAASTSVRLQDDDLDEDAINADVDDQD